MWEHERPFWVLGETFVGTRETLVGTRETFVGTQDPVHPAKFIHLPIALRKKQTSRGI